MIHHRRTSSEEVCCISHSHHDLSGYLYRESSYYYYYSCHCRILDTSRDTKKNLPFIKSNQTNHPDGKKKKKTIGSGRQVGPDGARARGPALLGFSVCRFEHSGLTCGYDYVLRHGPGPTDDAVACPVYLRGVGRGPAESYALQAGIHASGVVVRLYMA